MEPIAATDFFSFIIIIIIILLILICWNIYNAESFSKQDKKDPDAGIKADIEKLKGQIAECKKNCEDATAKLSQEIKDVKQDIQKNAADISARLDGISADKEKKVPEPVEKIDKILPEPDKSLDETAKRTTEKTEKGRNETLEAKKQDKIQKGA